MAWKGSFRASYLRFLEEIGACKFVSSISYQVSLSQWQKHEAKASDIRKFLNI